MMTVKKFNIIKTILFRKQVGVSLEEGSGFTNQNELVKICKNSKLTVLDFSTYDNTVLVNCEHNNVSQNVYVSYSYLTEKCKLNTENNNKIDAVFVYKEVSILSWLRELISPMSLALVTNILALLIIFFK